MDVPSPPRAATALGSPYVFTRFVLLRLLGLVYAVAFLIADRPAGAAARARRLPPVGPVPRAARRAGATADARGRCPRSSGRCLGGALHAAAWVGLALSLAVLLGVTNALLQFALWALYMSFVQVGQLCYGYGWETQLCETGFLAIFLCPLCVDPAVRVAAAARGRSGCTAG